jgi:hypothetical protein
MDHRGVPPLPAALDDVAAQGRDHQSGDAYPLRPAQGAGFDLADNFFNPRYLTRMVGSPSRIQVRRTSLSVVAVLALRTAWPSRSGGPPNNWR